MDIGWLRDMVIVIYGLMSILIVIFVAVLAYFVFRRISAIQRSVKRTLSNVESISAAGSEIAKPLARVLAFTEGISLAINAIAGFLQGWQRKEKDGKGQSG